MKKAYSYEYPHPALTADIVVITRERRPRVLLIRRKHDPFAGKWALPGGFVNEGEKIIDAARRELQEETGLRIRRLEPLGTFGDPGRDPRGWTVSAAFITLVNSKNLKAVAADDAAEVEWHALDRLPPLAFDHSEILKLARAWIKQV
jgi:8-oxo-dGTP diphosphatase